MTFGAFFEMHLALFSKISGTFLFQHDCHSFLFKKKRIPAMMLMQLSFLIVKIFNTNLLNAVAVLLDNFVV